MPGREMNFPHVGTPSPYALPAQSQIMSNSAGLPNMFEMNS